MTFSLSWYLASNKQPKGSTKKNTIKDTQGKERLQGNLPSWTINSNQDDTKTRWQTAENRFRTNKNSGWDK